MARKSALIEYAKSLDCIHCGLCLNECPTYRLTGNEARSPRGRVHLMRAEAEGRIPIDDAFKESMDTCLLCLGCESACPAGVEFEAMMELCRDNLEPHRSRGRLARWVRRFGFEHVLPSRRWLSLAAGALRLAQTTGATRLAALLGGVRGRALAQTPRVPPRAERGPLPGRTPALGERRAVVSVLAGCVMPELFGRVNRATVRVLSASGSECLTAAEHVCCGALHAHNGDLEGARVLARATIRAFEAHRDAADQPTRVVINSAGCGSHVKQYARLLAEDSNWRSRAEQFAGRVEDFCEYLCQEDRKRVLAGQLAKTDMPVVAYDDPCHLCHGQGIRSEPRELLHSIPELRLVELSQAEACCGSAGIHSILRPQESRAQLETKLDDLQASGAGVLVTANPGCHMQWQAGVGERGCDVEVLHIAEVLAQALDGPR